MVLLNDGCLVSRWVGGLVGCWSVERSIGALRLCQLVDRPSRRSVDQTGQSIDVAVERWFVVDRRLFSVSGSRSNGPSFSVASINSLMSSGSYIYHLF
jgi:hypothetical protein